MPNLSRPSMNSKSFSSATLIVTFLMMLSSYALTKTIII